MSLKLEIIPPLSHLKAETAFWSFSDLSFSDSILPIKHAINKP
jgi:hypothetical protein